MKFTNTPAGSYKIGDRKYELTRVTMIDEFGSVYDLGDVSFGNWNVYPAKRNCIIPKHWDEATRKAWWDAVNQE